MITKKTDIFQTQVSERLEGYRRIQAATVREHRIKLSLLLSANNN